MQPLKGIRVLDAASGFAGRLASGLLAEFGAEVVRADDAQTDLRFPQFVYSDQSKSRQEPSSDNASGLTVEQLDGFDVCFIESAEQLPTLTAEQLVVTVTPPYLAEGTPWAGGQESAELLHAYCGFSAYQASNSGRPVDLVYPFVTITQGLWAATCTVAALIERERSGLGQTVEVSGAHAANIFIGYLYAHEDALAEPDRAVGPGGLNPLYTRYRTADGEWFFLGALGPKFARAALEVTGSVHLLDDDRVGGNLAALWSADNHAWVRRHLEEVFVTKSTADWMRLLEAADVPCTVLQTREDWFDSAQIAAIGMSREISDPRLGQVRMPSVPIASIQARPGPPTLPQPSRGQGPLDGVRVASLGTFVAGPYAAGLLTELGADVIKVEPPDGDPWRMAGFAYNRGTRSLAIDLRQAAGKATFDDVLCSSDVVMNNFRLGVMGRLGLGFDRLNDVNPTLISVGVTAYGEAGALAPQPGYDTVLQAAAGIMTAQGGTAEPVVLSLPVNDHTTAVVGALTVVLGLLDRARFGNVRQLSTSLAATATFLQLTALTSYDGRPAPAVGGEDFSGPSPTDQMYPTRDGYLRVQFRPDTSAAVPELMAGKLAELSTADAATWCLEEDIPAVPVRTPNQVCSDEHLHARGLLQRATTSSGTAYTTPGRLVAFSRTRQSPLPDAPGLGEHTAEVLQQAKYSTDRIQALSDDGVVVVGQPLELEFTPVYR